MMFGSFRDLAFMGAALKAPVFDFPLATGGDEVFDIVVDGTTYRVHKFTTVGTSELVVLKGGDFEYLVVGGGGCGLNGGGGGGYFRKFVAGEDGNTDSLLTLASGPHPVTVGGGGINNMTGFAVDRTAPSGLPSLFATIEALGGAGAFNASGINIREGGDGGSGGGASCSANNQPGDGGTNGGNGGAAQRGSGGTGQDTPTETAISGVLTRYSGGGGGGVVSGATPGVGGAGGGGNGALGNNQASNGAPNTGGGGGGGGDAGGAQASERGGSGGSGIVIVRYAIA